MRPLVVLFAALLGCGGPDAARAPGRLDTPSRDEVLFLVKNEVFGIRLDGSGRRSYGTVGDDRHTAGYPRLLPDGRMSVLGSDAGAVREWVADAAWDFRIVGDRDSWVGDGACGAMVDGAPVLVYFASRLAPDGPSTVALRAATDGSDSRPIGAVAGAALLDPAPDGADHVLVVHTRVDGPDEIWRLDVSAADPIGAAVTVATVPWPLYASTPMRLADGRLALVTHDGTNADDPGQLELALPDGTLAPTGLYGIRAAVAVGDGVVYEADGASGVADLIVTDLSSPPRNLTGTPYVAEHLGWDTEP